MQSFDFQTTHLGEINNYQIDKSRHIQDSIEESRCFNQRWRRLVDYDLGLGNQSNEEVAYLERDEGEQI